MGRKITSDADCADCLCRVCARNSANDSWHPLVEAEDSRLCNCECKFGDDLIESEDDCCDFLPDTMDGDNVDLSDYELLWKTEKKLIKDINRVVNDWHKYKSSVMSGELVKVVRCKDCKHFRRIENSIRGVCKSDKMKGSYGMGTLYMIDSDYCSNGEEG